MYPASVRIGMMAASTTDSNGDPKMNATRKAAVIVIAFWYILDSDSVRFGSVQLGLQEIVIIFCMYIGTEITNSNA